MVLKYFCNVQRLADLEERLGGLNTGDAEVVGIAIDEFCDVVYPGEKSPLHRYGACISLFSVLWLLPHLSSNMFMGLFCFVFNILKLISSSYALFHL